MNYTNRVPTTLDRPATKWKVQMNTQLVKRVM